MSVLTKVTGILPSKMSACAVFVLSVPLLCLFLTSCGVITVPYRVLKGTVQGTYYVVKGAYELTAGTTKLVYHVGKFTFKVVKAPINWALTNDDIETIDGLSPKEAIRQGRVKNAPYKVKGKMYYPMSIEKSYSYQETGVASWYGYETMRGKGGRMTANGEVFDPKGLTAAHKHLPLPIHVKVTNLENDRWIVVRVNDRGPFPSDFNAASGDRIIDLSEGAAKRLDFYDKGLARVKVETIQLGEDE